MTSAAQVSRYPSVLLVDDQELQRLGLKISLQNMGCCQILGEARDGLAAVAETERLRPDIVLMDVGLPGIDGIESTWRIKQSLPQTRVVMFTSRDQPQDITAALGAGADGYCIKDTPVAQIARAISAVMHGEVWIDPDIADAVMRSRSVDNGKSGVPLSDIEMEILALFREGLGNIGTVNGLDENDLKIARIMGAMISKFKEQAKTIVANQPVKLEDSKEWLIGLAQDSNGEKIFAEKYQLGNKLGSGGIGAVFKARHVYMDRTVALKVIRPELCEDRISIRNFQREAMAIANLRHKNIVEVYDFGIDSGNVPFMVMEHIAGTNLAELLEKEHRLHWRRAVNICGQVCAGMSAAHAKGVIHCDLKPSNILISTADSVETVKLVDFGLAQLLPQEPTKQSQLTEKFYVCGTPYYMSPEQCSGKSIDARSDIYSLGCLIYEALTGAKPFQGGTAAETFHYHCTEIANSISSVYPQGNFPPALDHCVGRMLAKDPAHRPQSMNEVMVLLRTIAAVC